MRYVTYRFNLNTNILTINFYIKINIKKPVPIVRRSNNFFIQYFLQLTVNSFDLSIITIKGSVCYNPTPLSGSKKYSKFIGCLCFFI